MALLLSAAGCGGDTPSPDAGTDSGPACASGQAECGGVCIDTTVDVDNCGGCDMACPTGEVCSGGACALFCGGTTPTLCGGGCVDTDSNNANCGACGTACAAGELCSAGACATSCGAGLTDCSGSCRDTATDNANCGACGTACAAGELCSGGACATSCGAGLTDCFGTCRDTAADNANCGACGAACAAGELCTSSTCTVSCGGGFTNCSGTCRDLTTDNANCGACGTACAAGEVCSGSSCTTSCGAGLTDCAGTCRDLTSDRSNCGTCGATCAAGEACSGSTCGTSCGAGLTNCSGTCTNTAFDPTNCGTCASVCPMRANSVPFCSSSTCGFSCLSGFFDCDRMESNGCEATSCGGSAFFDGTFGATWETLAVPPQSTYSLMTYQPASGIADIYNMYPAVGQRYDPGANTWTSLVTTGPGSFIWASMAPYAGQLYMIRNSNVYQYDPGGDAWTTLLACAGCDDLNMTESDEFGHIFGHASSGEIIDYDVAAGTITRTSTGLGGEYETRMGYDPGTRTIFFGAYNTRDLHTFHIPSATVTATVTVHPESQLNDIFCSDRSGHIYAAGGSSGTTMWKYDIATDTWSSLPDLPTSHGNNGTCTVSARTRDLYVGTGSSGAFYRIPLGP